MTTGVGILGPIFAVFVVTQCGYFVVNALAFAFVYTRSRNVVPDEAPAEYRPLKVILPVYGERRTVLERTLAGIFDADYPRHLLSVFVVYEADDPVVSGYVDDLRADAGDGGFDFQTVAVDRDAFLWDAPSASWLDGNESDEVPRTKATALRYAFRTGGFLPDDVITVFDSDTQVPPDLFRLGVRGLEAYDVVQAKQTVRNGGDGWLPRLEAMGMAAWSHAVYTRTSTGPYQLLGKGYFASAKTLYDVGDWRPDAVTEDMALGLDAYGKGYSLGVIDRYVQDLCPSSADEWVRQKARWVSGPYLTTAAASLDPRSRVRFLTYAVLNQFVSVLNVVGVPAGVAAFALTVTGMGPDYPPWLTAVVLVNAVGWAYYSILAYYAAHRAIPFDSRWKKLTYFTVSNPLTQALYATVWVVPIALAFGRYVRHEPQRFTVTAK